MSHELDQLVASAQIPGLPQSAIRMLELSKDPENGPPEFAQAIEIDPGLTGQILKFVNSSYFGFAKEITSVRHAITLLGVRTIKNFTLWSAVFSVMPNPQCGAFEVRHLWHDSLVRGLFARRVSRCLKVIDPEEVFAAALLQDMAISILVKQWPNEYTELLERRAETRERLSNLEMDRFGWHHGHAAELMCRKWGLPESFTGMIGRHVEYDEHNQDNDPSWVSVGLSSMLPSVVDQGWENREQFVEAMRNTLPGVKLQTLLGDVDLDFTEFAPILNIRVGCKSLIHRFAAGDAVVAR